MAVEPDPEDDPNNQGEDEFEEAEDEQAHHKVRAEEVVEEDEEPAARAQHRDTHPGPEQPVVEEDLVVRKKPEIKLMREMSVF